MWDKGCLSTEQTNKHPGALWSWNFGVVSTIRKDPISQVQKDKGSQYLISEIQPDRNSSVAGCFLRVPKKAKSFALQV